MANLYGPLAQLNGPWAWTASLSGAGAQNAQLTVGKTYALQAQSGDVFVGFGATTAAADTAGGLTKGLRLLGDALPTIVAITADAMSCISRTPVSGTTELRICEVVGA